MAIPRLMLVTDRYATRWRDLAEIVAAAVAGGVDAVQVREKDLSDNELLALTLRIQKAVAGKAAVLVNGRPLVARATKAGLHLPGDFPTLPADDWPLWGRSVHSVEEACRRAEERPDYLLLGTIFQTTSKPDHAGSGLELVRETVRALPSLPLIAIGGIDANNARSVIEAGASGVAVRSAILEALDPKKATECIYASLIIPKIGSKPNNYEE